MKTATLNCQSCGFVDALISNHTQWGEVVNCPQCDGPAEYTLGDFHGMIPDSYEGEGKYVQAMDKTYHSRSEFKRDLELNGYHVKEIGEDRDAKAKQFQLKQERRKRIEEMVDKNINKPWQRNVPDPNSRVHKPAGYKGDPKTVELDPRYEYGVGADKHA